MQLNETQKKKNSSYGSHPPANALSREQLQQRMQAALQNGQGTTRKRPQDLIQRLKQNPDRNRPKPENRLAEEHFQQST